MGQGNVTPLQAHGASCEGHSDNSSMQGSPPAILAGIGAGSWLLALLSHPCKVFLETSKVLASTGQQGYDTGSGHFFLPWVL